MFLYISLNEHIFKIFLGQLSHSLFVRDLDPVYHINLELQGHLDDYLRYINTSDVLGDCLNKCSCLFVCVVVRMLFF